jgi:hypothetical protein
MKPTWLSMPSAPHEHDDAVDDDGARKGFEQIQHVVTPDVEGS